MPNDNRLQSDMRSAFAKKQSPSVGLSHQIVQAAADRHTIRQVRWLAFCAVIAAVMLAVVTLALTGKTLIFYIAAGNFVFVLCGGITLYALYPRILKAGKGA